MKSNGALNFHASDDSGLGSLPAIHNRPLQQHSSSFLTASQRFSSLFPCKDLRQFQAHRVYPLDSSSQETSQTADSSASGSHSAEVSSYLLTLAAAEDTSSLRPLADRVYPASIYLDC